MKTTRFILASLLLCMTALRADATPPTISSLSPADNANGVSPSANLAITFSEAIMKGTGNITIRNLTDSTQTTIAITDATQVSVSGTDLTINPTADLAMLKNYAIQIDASAIKDLSGNSFSGIADNTTWNFRTTRILADVGGDFRTVAAGGSSASFNGGTGIPDLEGTGRWNYLNGEASTNLTFGVAGNAGQSMYQTTGQPNGLPALGDRQIFSNVAGPTAGKIQLHAGNNTARSAIARWTAGTDFADLAISGNIAHGIAQGSARFEILINEVNLFTTTLTDTTPRVFNLSGVSIAAGQHVKFILSDNGDGNGGDIANLQATISTSPSVVTAPVVESQPATGLTGYTAVLNGRVTSTGNDTPGVTIVWGTSDAGISVGAWANSANLGAKPRAFGHLAGNLQPGTTYYFRALATNSAGAVWTNTQTFTTNAKSPIVINEIHYKPGDRTKQIEFIELHNPSTTTAFDLSAWRLAGGVDFVFPTGSSIPAGGFRVLAANSAAFQAYYGFAPYGQWNGTLKNTGELLELRDAANLKVDDVDYAAGFPWPTSAAGGGPSIELIHPGLENDRGAAWRSSASNPVQQTPGALNSVSAAVAPPAVREVNHTPNAAVAGQPVVITARISDENGIASATLQYQTVDPGAYIRRSDAAFETSWTSLPMNDAGTEGDFIAGDGVYSATIPSMVQTHRRLVRYRIFTRDTLGSAITLPYSDDEQANFAYFVYNGVPGWAGSLEPGAGGTRDTELSYPSSLLASQEPWHLIANGSDVENSQYNPAFNDQRFQGTLVYDGKVYDHIYFKNRGQVSTYVTGKNKWTLFFNRARDIRVKDNWGRYYEPWNSMSLDANASPWCAVHRGSTGVEEAVSYRMYELAGMPALRTNYVHWRVIDSATESGPTQYDGDLWGLYMALEPMEGNFLDERGLPDGNVYDIAGSGGDKKHQGATQSIDASDWNTFRDSANQPGQTETWYRQNMDLNALYTFFALNRLNGNVDIRVGDNFRFYHNPTNINGGSNGHWVIAPYDLDMMFVCGHHWTANIDGSEYSGVTDQFRAITRHAALGLGFRNRARELLDLLASDASANGGQIGQLIDEYAGLVAPTGTTPNWASLDAAIWNLNPRTAGSGTPTSNSGYTSHKNNFFRTPYYDRRGEGGTPATNWTRTLSDPDNDGYSDFNGLMTWFRNYATNTWTGGTWERSNGNQNGYGYKYLEWESLYGGLGPNPSAPDLSFPNTPVITYVYEGAGNFPANALDFSSTAFSPSAIGGTTFGAIQWRIGEIYAPGIPGYVAGEPRKYEIEDVWTSAELTSFSATVRVPVASAKPGRTYRARVRHKDANGRWSHWSAPVQFTVGTPDISVYLQSLVVTEVNYNPAPASSAEIAAGFGSDDFEWIEVKNTGTAPLDMTGVRFTKGVNFDFPAAYSLPAGGFALIVKNVTAFQMRYGTGFNAIIAGSYPSDNLSNSGEELKLSYGAGTEIRRFTYDDAAPWPIEPDGTGRTLVLRSPQTIPNHALPSSWRTSITVGGSPGADDGSVYSLWQTTNGAPGQTANQDHDGDGVPNGVEHFLGGNTNTTGFTALPGVVNSGGTLSVTWPKGSGYPGEYLTDFVVETSETLTGSWTVEALAPGGPVTETSTSVRYTFPIPLGARKFVRLRIFGP